MKTAKAEQYFKAIDEHRVEHNISTAFVTIENTEIQELVSKLLQLDLKLHAHVVSDEMQQGCTSLVTFLKQQVTICKNILISFDAQNNWYLGSITSEAISTTMAVCKKQRGRNDLSVEHLQVLDKIFHFVEICSCIITERPIPKPIVVYDSLVDIPLELVASSICDISELLKMLLCGTFASLQELTLKINENISMAFKQAFEKEAGLPMWNEFVFKLDVLSYLCMFYVYLTMHQSKLNNV